MFIGAVLFLYHEIKAVLCHFLFCQVVVHLVKILFSIIFVLLGFDSLQWVKS